MMNINLHVEQIAFEGLHFSARQLSELSRTFKRELESLMRDRGWSPDQLRRVGVAALETGAIDLQPRLDSGEVGKQLAQTIFTEIEKRVRRSGMVRSGDAVASRTPRHSLSEDMRRQLERHLGSTGINHPIESRHASRQPGGMRHKPFVGSNSERMKQTL